MSPPNFCCRAIFSPTGLPKPLARLADGWSNAFHHDGFNFAGAAAPESGSLVVFRRRETRDALLERREFDHYESVKLVRTFHNLKTTPSGQHFSAKLCDDDGYQIGVLFIL